MSSHAAKNHGSDPAVAIATVAGTARTEPAVMIQRGPWRSSTRPTGIPTTADTTKPAENAAMTVLIDQPVSRAIDGASTGKA